MKKAIYKALSTEGLGILSGYLIQNKYILDIDDDESLEDILEFFDWAIYEIYPETICEFTGYSDKKGKMVFTNDIIKTSVGDVGVVVFENASYKVRVETEHSVFYQNISLLSDYKVIDCLIGDDEKINI